MEVDVIDVRDPDQGRARHRCLNQLGARSARIELPRRSDLSSFMVGEVCRVASPGELRVLRIWSSSPPGYEHIAPAQDAPTLTPAHGLLALSRELGLLHSLFARGAHAELRGCGDGLHGPGRLFAQTLARIWRVPVQAGQVFQTTGEWLVPIVQAAPSGALMIATGSRIWSQRRAG
ncbi:MAG TPA: hypothetical protein VMM12_05850 [Longimicrobiales bacterium]|nr:hypothetical protein [Longimicrobiales bacterium]